MQIRPIRSAERMPDYLPSRPGATLRLLDLFATSVFPDIAPPEPRLIRSSRRRLQRRGRWRSWVACCALVALAWPSLGLLPWVGIDLPATDHVGAQARAFDASGPSSVADHHDGDGSEIPGSPTHPADHDCFQCQVLKHLSRCAVSPLELPTIPLQPGCPVQPRVRVGSQFAAQVVALPPATGPPLPSA
jgi:hypothetical protein